jgi:hypothetical protein
MSMELIWIKKDVFLMCLRFKKNSPNTALYTTAECRNISQNFTMRWYTKTV